MVLACVFYCVMPQRQLRYDSKSTQDLALRQLHWMETSPECLLWAQSQPTVTRPQHYGTLTLISNRFDRPTTTALSH